MKEKKKNLFSAKRRLARESVLKILYAYDVSQNPIDFCVDNFFNFFYTETDSDDVIEYTKKIAYGTIEMEEVIDEQIEKYSENWTLDRMVIIDRNILRFSVYEILYVEEVPPLVSLNEALEIGKVYGNSDSQRFINGILDKIVKKMRKKK